MPIGSRRRRNPAAWRGAWPLACALCWSHTGAAELPPEGRCPTLSGLPSGPAEDASPARVQEGALLALPDALRLASLFPVEVWRNRAAFFHEGMQMEIGPCHHRYPQASFYRAATEHFAGQARIDSHGNLLGYTAGLPFPPDSIDPHADDAGIRWAWNFELRYRGAGPSGQFRIVDMPSRIGAVQTYTGSWFLLQTSHRADLSQTDYRVTQAAASQWIAGGRFLEPANVRHVAWRQLRPLEVARRYDLPDETFVYLPALRKVRRAASPWVDGVYLPRYRVTDDAGSGSIVVGGADGRAPTGSISPSAGASLAATENLRRGFTGLSIRPNAYVWRWLGEREVLAPLNVSRSGFPHHPDRNFGTSGLSAASDRWEVRQAVVIQGSLLERGREYDLLTLYLDRETQQPLYYITKRRQGGRLVEVGILLHRYSGDQIQYPSWPDGEKACVFDPVAALFVESEDGGSGWRREAYDVRSTPPDADELRRITSTGYLERGH